MTKEELKTLIKEEFENLIEIQRKLYKEPEPDQKKAAMDKMVEFVRSLSKGLTEGTDSAGGYLVPEEFRAEVLRIAKDVGYAMRLATQIPMKTDTMNIPSLASSVSVGWVTEGNAASESTPTFGQVQLSAKKMMALTVISNELLEDAGVDVVNLLTTLFGEAIAEEIDKQVFTGSGSPFTGILNNSNVNITTMGSGDTTYDKVDFDDLINVVASVDANAKKGAAWFMHPTVVAVIRKLKDSNGQYLWAPPVGGQPATILGYPVYEIIDMPATSDSSQANKAFIAFGNLKYVYLGIKGDMSVDVLKEATIGSTNLGETDQRALRIKQRIGFAIALPDAFGVLKTAAS